MGGFISLSSVMMGAFEQNLRKDGSILEKNWEKIGDFRRKMSVFDQFYSKNLKERQKFQFSDEFFRNDGSILCIFFRRDG